MKDSKGHGSNKRGGVQPHNKRLTNVARTAFQNMDQVAQQHLREYNQWARSGQMERDRKADLARREATDSAYDRKHGAGAARDAWVFAATGKRQGTFRKKKG